MMKYFFLLLMGVFAIGLSNSHAQEVSPKVASDYFDAGNYEKAKVAYKSLLDKYSRNPLYNYYYGVTLVLTKDDYSEAIKRLRFAALSGAHKDVHFYLGRALHLTYEFVEAKKSYLQFKKVASLGDVRVSNTTKYIQECDFGILNTSKYYAITVEDKDTISIKSLLKLYSPSRDAGYLLKNSDFFQSGVDPNGIMYMTQRQDEAYFSLYTVGSRGQDLYKMVKLLDGWSDNDALPANVNTAFDEAYPFMASNGSTLYFASNKPGGFGGFDIYRTEYNDATKTYTDPVNMGIPFNSPDDDLLFVTDDFGGSTWFASNRETTGDVMMVYKVNWNQMTPKSSVADIRDVKAISQLAVSTVAIENAQRKGEFTYQSEMAKSRNANKFKFEVNDTLTYVNYDQFKSADALKYFKTGFSNVSKRDSLNSKMREKRALFQMTDDAQLRDKVVVDILKMEKELYGYDETIEENYFIARRLEVEALREIAGSGNYKAGKISQPNTFNLEDDIELNPEKYQFYSEEAFEKRAKTYESMYKNLFDDIDIDKLMQADSLYVWGSILTLESSSLLDKAAHSTSASEMKFKSEKDLNQENTTEQLLADSKKMKEVSLRYLLLSLDEKYNVYSLKLGEILPQISAERGRYFADESGKANGYYREGASMYSSDAALASAQIEKVISLKKTAVDIQDKLLFEYASKGRGGNNSASTVVVKASTAVETKVTPTFSAPTSPQPKDKTVSSSGLVYKIQIGVFRNRPSQDLLSQLDDVTYEPVEGKDVVKYFSGNYKSSDEAVSHIASVKEAGFPSAFLVAFLDGVQIDLSKAKSIEK